MKDELQHTLLEQARAHIRIVQEHISAALELTGRRTAKMKTDIRNLEGSDRMVQQTILAYTQKQLDDLEQLEPSPYFARLRFASGEDGKTYYIGKFSFPDEHIYSWITPIAALRFESPGDASYTRPDGSTKAGTLKEKAQYMISNGQLLFYATESVDAPRELVYQEHFTRTKKGFVLQDVVEQMEKAQDQIIRADAQGPLLISGPAGSGKTTLALHRVAYLLQSPETQALFPPERILVLVQDAGTKDYFSSLLPDLGIKGVDIQTFSEWALGLLGVTNVAFTLTAPVSHSEAYEAAKLQALRALPSVPFTRSVFTVLSAAYKTVFTPEQQQSFAMQKKQRMLDRIDLTILLTLYKQKVGSFTFQKEYFLERADGSYVKKMGTFPASYNLFVIDEFQNYLPEQLNLLLSCSNEQMQSVIFVGDMNQQTLFGTVSQWSDVSIDVKEDRKIVLQKVYRNTQEILRYIAKIGYSVHIPEQLAEGSPVEDVISATHGDVVAYVESIHTGSIGILAHTAAPLEQYKGQFKNNPRVHCLTFQEAQGVEFESVCIVGVNKDAFDISHTPAELREEKKKIERDLLYVALTRAMNDLRVFGECTLEEASRPLFS